MTQKDKELLLIDLCARLPYNVLVRIYDIDVCNYDNYLCEDYLGKFRSNFIRIKPYLRPISSMTEEEKKELQKVTDDTFYTRSYYIGNSKPYTDGEWHTSHNNFVTNIVCNKLISWLDKNHFDHRTDDEGKTLIEKGLALEAPEGMY